MWIVHVDGAWGASGAGVAAILTLPSGIKLGYVARLEFQCTNNTAEYEAVILELSKLRALSARRAVIKTDSQVIAGHIEKSFEAREPELQKYLQLVCKIEAFFLGITTKSIPHSENSEADELQRLLLKQPAYPQMYSSRLCSNRQPN